MGGGGGGRRRGSPINAVVAIFGFYFDFAEYLRLLVGFTINEF